MKRITRWSLLLAGLVLCALPAAALAGENPGFEKMKSLVGEWEGLTEEGEVSISYRLVSDGTALMETLVHAGESEMVTIYTADGDRVALTHYCNENNQPRMQSGPISASPEELAYSFVGGTNMASPATPHMHNLVVSFEGGDEFTQRWTWRDQEKEVTTTFHFKRKKSS